MSLIPASEARPNAELVLIHFGDLHLWRVGCDGDPYIKRILGLINLLVRRARRFPPWAARAIAARLASEHADVVVCAGDVTTASLRAEFEAARRLLAPLFDRWGERCLTIPGNHDRYTPRATRERLYERLFDGRRTAPVWSEDLNERWTLVAVDASTPRPLSARGHLTAAALSQLDTVLADAAASGRRLIVLGHYPIAYPAGFRPSPTRVLPERAQLLAVLRRHGVEAYLHGHEHHRWRLALEGLTAINCGSAGYWGRVPERRPGYVKLTLPDAGPIRIDAVEWVDERWQMRPL